MAIQTSTARLSLTRRPRRLRRSEAIRSSGTATVRAWAKAHGYEIAERGRIPANIVAAFHAAHPSQ